MDASDNERISKILDHLKMNQLNLQDQLKNQYSINYETIRQFNETIKNIEHNENELKSRIQQLNIILNENIQHTHILYAKDIFNQLVILYNTLLNVLSDIDNSLVFCKLGIMHPSIITPNDLFLELQRISFHYNNQLPFEIKIENILDYESIMEVHCQVDTNKINYFLSIPINYEINFEIFYLLPIPTRHSSNFLTIIPNTKYLLKSDQNVIYALHDICTKNKLYQCNSKLLANFQSSCENEVVTKGNTSCCQYTRLAIQDSHIERIPEIDQYLGVFPNPETLKIKCKEEEESRILSGIILLKNSPCQVSFKGNPLPFSDETYGKPIIVGNVKFEIEKLKTSNFTIQLRTLKLDGIPSYSTVPVHQYGSEYHKPSIWTIFLYFAIITTTVYLVVRWKKKKGLPKPNQSCQAEELPRNDLNLPGDAPF